MKLRTNNRTEYFACLRPERLFFTTPDWLKVKLGLDSFVGLLVRPRERLLAGEGEKEHPLPVLWGHERGLEDLRACVWLQSHVAWGWSSLFCRACSPSESPSGSCADHEVPGPVTLWQGHRWNRGAHIFQKDEGQSDGQLLLHPKAYLWLLHLQFHEKRCQLLQTSPLAENIKESYFKFVDFCFWVCFK